MGIVESKVVEVVSFQYCQISLRDVEVFGWSLPVTETNSCVYSAYKIDDFIVVAFVLGWNVFPLDLQALFT